MGKICLRSNTIGKKDYDNITKIVSLTLRISYLFSAIAQVYLTVMKNCDAVNLSTFISSVTVILNIILNAVLVFGLFGIPAMGIKGAALATVTATAVQMFLCAVHI